MTSRRRVLATFAGGLLALQLGWMLAFPPYWGIDEVDHVYRSASVAHGHWEPSTTSVDPSKGRGEIVEIPASVAKATRGACEAHFYNGKVNCTPQPSSDPGMVTISSAAGRYNPFFYAVDGLAGRPFSGQAALFVMRAISAIWCCLLLVGALWATMTWARTRWPYVGLLMAATPTTLYSSTVAAPNGVHMTAAITLWCALLALVHTPEERLRPPLAALTVVATATTLWTHTLGVVWVPLIFASVWLLGGRPSPRSLLPRSRAAWWLLALVLSYAAAAAWILLARTNAPGNEMTQANHVNPWPYVVGGWALWPLQAVAAFPNRDEHAPTVVYAVWVAAFVVMLIMAVPLMGRRFRDHRRAILAVTAISFAVPSVLTVLTMSQLGTAWQGRYSHPLSAGVVLMVSVVLERAGRYVLRAWLATTLAALLVVINVVSQLGVLHRLSRTHGLVRATGWHIPGDWVFLTAGAVSVALVGFSMLRFPAPGTTGPTGDTVEPLEVAALPSAPAPAPVPAPASSASA